MSQKSQGTAADATIDRKSGKTTSCCTSMTGKLERSTPTLLMLSLEGVFAEASQTCSESRTPNELCTNFDNYM